MKLTTLAANLLLVAPAPFASPLSDQNQAAMDAFRAKRSSSRPQGSRGTFNNPSGFAKMGSLITDRASPSWNQASLRLPALLRSPCLSFHLVATLIRHIVVLHGWELMGGSTAISSRLASSGASLRTKSTIMLWYEYLPGTITFFDGVTISAGSVVAVNATKTGDNSGITTLTVDGTTVSHTFSGQSAPVPGSSAEWIVEDYFLSLEERTLVPFADFGNVAFTDMSVVVNGAAITPADGSWLIIDMVQNNTTLTPTTLFGNKLDVDYV